MLSFLSFNDFDDSLWVMPHSSDPNQNKRIKNPHLLLPILLFQTLADNQHIFILTNRSSSEAEVLSAHSYSPARDYTTREFIADVQQFGIIIHPKHVIFGGNGGLRSEQEKLAYEFYHSIDVLTAQLKHLNLDESKLSAQKNTLAFLQASGLELYGGKNFFARTFLESHTKEDKYIFEDGHECPIEGAQVVIMDDLPSVKEPCEAAGYIGIQVSRGGKLPKAGSKDELKFYDDSYLIEKSHYIGLESYLESLLETPKNHLYDPPMLKASALMFGWHTMPKQITSKVIKSVLVDLSMYEFEMLIRMLEYIQANTHEKAQNYHEVNPLLELVQSLFLDNVDLIKLKGFAKASKAKSSSSLGSFLSPKRNRKSHSPQRKDSEEVHDSVISYDPANMVPISDIHKRILCLAKSESVLIQSQAMGVLEAITSHQKKSSKSKSSWQRSSSTRASLTDNSPSYTPLAQSRRHRSARVRTEPRSLSDSTLPTHSNSSSTSVDGDDEAPKKKHTIE